MFNKITILASIVIAFLFISPSVYNQNISSTEQLVDNNFLGSTSIYVYDIEGDAKNDIAGTAGNGNEVSWWRNEGGTTTDKC